MTISERIFELIKERGYTQKEFSKRTGIAESTISDWKKKGTNPVSDKILIICKVLEVSPYFLLSGSEDPDVVAKPAVRKVPTASVPVKKPVAAVAATISNDDDDYHIRPIDDDKDSKDKKKDKKKDKDELKDKKEKKKDKKDKKKDKDKKKKKKGYLITY